MKRKKLPKSLALFLAATMTFSTAGILTLAPETEAAADGQAIEAETKSAPEVQTVADTPAPAAETLATEAPTTEAPTTETSTTEAPTTETPTTETPTTEAPSTETPTTETLTTEAPTTEAPSTETPTTETPTTETPTTETPTTETPSTEAPTTETPSTEAPTTETPATEAPTTETPTTEAPTTETPTTEAPSTETPATETPESEKVEYCVTFDSHAADYGKIIVDNQLADVVTYKKQVVEKESFTFSVVPNEGYETEYVRVDGIDVPKTEQQGEYKLAAVEKDTIITVTYRKAPEIENVVTFQMGEGAAAFAQDGTPITSTAMAKNGKIIFSIIAEEGYTVEEVLVDGYIPARHTDNPNEYIIEGISTDETIVTASTVPAETEEESETETEETEAAEKESEDTSEDAEGTAQINGGEEQQDVEVRASADGLSEILFTLPHGAHVTVLGAEGDWIRIEYEGQTGYVYKASLFLDGAEAPQEPEAEKAQPKATIFSSRSAVMEPGETVTLTSRLEHADGYEIRYQWECDRGDGFEAIEGANSDTYTFAADTQTLSYDWRLVVYYR